MITHGLSTGSSTEAATATPETPATPATPATDDPRHAGGGKDIISLDYCFDF